MLGRLSNWRERAVGEFGRIDVWMNCAALLLVGCFEEIPPGDFRRVVEANLIGYAERLPRGHGAIQGPGDRGGPSVGWAVRA